MGSWSWSQVEASLGSDVSWKWGGVHRSTVGSGVGGSMVVDWGSNDMAGISMVDWSGDDVMRGGNNVVRCSNMVRIRNGSWCISMSVHCWPARVLGDWSGVDWSMSPGGVGPDSRALCADGEDSQQTSNCELRKQRNVNAYPSCHRGSPKLTFILI